MTIRFEDFNPLKLNPTRDLVASGKLSELQSFEDLGGGNYRTRTCFYVEADIQGYTLISDWEANVILTAIEVGKDKVEAWIKDDIGKYVNSFKWGGIYHEDSRIQGIVSAYFQGAHDKARHWIKFRWSYADGLEILGTSENQTPAPVPNPSITLYRLEMVGGEFRFIPVSK